MDAEFLAPEIRFSCGSPKLKVRRPFRFEELDIRPVFDAFISRAPTYAWVFRKLARILCEAPVLLQVSRKRFRKSMLYMHFSEFLLKVRYR